MTRHPPVLAVTPGDPAGVGPEILVRFLEEHPAHRLIAVADGALLEQAASKFANSLETREWRPGQNVSQGVLNFLQAELLTPATPGRPDPRNAEYVLNTLRQAVTLVQDGQAAALVTGPVHKGIINESGVPFTGHTEFLAELADVPQVVMMLAAPGLRVCLATTHLPLRAVADALTPETLDAVIRITENALQRQFGLEQPRLQVLGLNPHAGEGGHLGEEEDEIILPVLDRLRAAGLNLDGPVPADTAFTPPRLAECDAVIAMYHDQGLPVLKHMGFGRSINITLGLPFIRTSVDHGTALDLAGSGLADIGSFREAVLTAERMAGVQTPGPSA